MKVPAGKKVVCITGSVWTGEQHAPRHLLVKDGFVRPTWFTTRVGINDAKYKIIGESEFRLARANSQILLSIKYANDSIGIMKDSFLEAMNESALGVLVVGPQDVAAQLSDKIPQTTIFTLKSKSMDISPHLKKAQSKGQLHRIDIEEQNLENWEKAHQTMREILNL